jgi:hypothetical protein
MRFTIITNTTARYRKHPPKSYLEIKARALTQRLTIQNRERLGTDDAPKEKVMVAGTTGNLYTVDIGLVPQCNCPHAAKGNQCKHILYVMLRVLKAPEHLAYQLALTTSELRQVFEHAPPIPKADAEAEESDGNRKPIEGECPICYTEFEPLKEKIVYCKAACGNNVHDECMRHWMQARQGKATCPYCRAAWAESELTGRKVNIAGATRNAEGYINVASQLGLSGERGMSFFVLLASALADLFRQTIPHITGPGSISVLGLVATVVRGGLDIGMMGMSIMMTSVALVVGGGLHAGMIRMRISKNNTMIDTWSAIIFLPTDILLALAFLVYTRIFCVTTCDC